MADFALEYVQNQMTTQYGLQKVELPDSTIYATEEFLNPDQENNSSKTALILFQGTGAVRAGMWARSVCVNSNFMLGSMLPQLDWAVNHNKYAALVMNPNFSKEAEEKSVSVGP